MAWRRDVAQSDPEGDLAGEYDYEILSKKWATPCTTAAVLIADRSAAAQHG